MLLTAVANAAISPFGILRASDYIYSCNASVASNSVGKVTIDFSIKANDVMSKLGVKTIVLQERANASSSWGTYDTYSYEDYDNMMTDGAKSYSNNITVNVNSGYQYRAKVYF